ncbi:LysM repeat protein [Metabacillus crassostreae]|uniref:LysM peptidoglycan-binding domain-containing protein n=1 Tax=Metabacillus crassostreae TaxID=929098 RepID=UPI0019583E40|nr:LysM peptidoglycan-binding domain-containing protein [Metabacillus crassostreae]MBM7602845.1 LysM repeat protein [Metabacillus crassostreae]
MKFDRYEVKIDQHNNYTLIIYLDSYLTEFSDELHTLQVEKQDLQKSIRQLIKTKFPHIPIKTAKVVAGTMIVTTLYLYGPPGFQSHKSASAQTLQEVKHDTYTVASGDSLSLIGKKFNVSVATIKALNNLTSDTIFVGQIIKLPYFTYTVVAGDSLSVIAKRYNTTTEQISSFNELTNYTINIGQKLKIPLNLSIPVQEPATTPIEPTIKNDTYTVVSGDTLSLIAKKLNTTVESLRSLNNLTTDMIFVGQVLIVTKSQQETIVEEPIISNEPIPTGNETTYTVVAGDSLSLIAKKFSTTVAAIQETNELPSTIIRVGQVLKIPVPTTDSVITPEIVNEEPALLTTYTVVSGDSLSLIAKKFNTTVTTIKEANNLPTNTIYIGQVLTISQPTIQAPKDTIAPTVPVIEATTVINKQNQSNVSLSGKAEEHETLEVTITDQQQNTVSFEMKADNSGQYQHNVDVSTLNDGTLTVIAIARDEAGNKSPESQIIMKKDTISQVPSLSTTDMSQNNMNSYFISGSADAGSIVTIIASDETKNLNAEAIANERGEFQVFMNVSSLQDGDITITAKAIDPSKNESEPTSKIVKKDTLSTTPTLIPIPFINKNLSTNVVVKGNSEENTSIVLTATDGLTQVQAEAKADEMGLFQQALDLSKLNDGNITITSTSTDAIGNRSEAATMIVVKDTKTTEPILEKIEDVTSQNAHQFQLSGMTEENAVVNITISDEQNQTTEKKVKADENGRFQESFDLRNLHDGKLTLTAYSVDELENVSSITQGTILKDTIVNSPKMEVPSYINNSNETNVPIIGLALPGSTILITFTDKSNTVKSVETTANEAGEYEAIANLSDLEDKEIIVSVIQTSLAGIKSDATVGRLIKDTEIPHAPTFHNDNYINSENQNAYILSGMAEASAIISISIDQLNGQTIDVETTTSETGEFSISVDLSTFNDGDINFSLFQTDVAGNKGETISKTLIKDTLSSSKLDLNVLRTIYNGNVYNYQLSGVADPHTSLSLLFTDGENTQSVTVESDENGLFDVTVDMSKLQDGDIKVSFQTKDSAGNIGELEPAIITKDTTSPAEAVATVAPYINQENMNEYKVSGASVEEGATVTIVATDGVKTIEETALVYNGSFSKDLNLSTLKDSIITFTITQTDRAGNTSIVSAATVEKDTVIKEPTVSKNGFRYENLQSIYTMIGTGESNATINVIAKNQNGESLLTTSSEADNNGFYTISMYLDVLEARGNITVSISQTDLAGNRSEIKTITLQAHTVSEGETLEDIAKRYNTSVVALTSLNQLSSSIVSPNQQLLLPISASEVINLGYMYFGNTKDYINMVNSTSHSVNVVAPSYFDIHPDGTLKLTYQVDASFISMMHMQGKRVVPFLSNHWDRELGRAMLANKELAAQQIADAIERYNLDGVNVDIENVTAADRQDYTEFVRLLREKIPSSKEVSVAVAANPNGWTTGWHGSYDYTELAKYADYLMIMSYDESYPGGEAGSVASYNWVERSVQYALSQNVSSDKIVLGVAHFGRYWMEGASYGGHGISNSQVHMMIDRYNGEVQFDELSKTPKAIITIREGDPETVIGGNTLAPGSYEIWFENEESISNKLSLISQYNLKGVGNWSIGQENKEVWKTYATSLPQTLMVTAPAPTATTSYLEYRVVAGDTLWVIAQRNNTTIQTIKEINGLTSDSLTIGQILKLPQKQQEPVSEVTASSTMYKVVSGDSLSLIAKNFNTTVTAIKEKNQITSDMIYVGQTLVIPSTT